MARIKRGDDVIVLVGKCRGQRGTVLSIDVELERVTVEGVNLVKRHQKPNPQRNSSGGIVEKEASMHLSNVAIFDAIAGKGSRVGMTTMTDGSRVRVFRGSGEVVDV